MHESSFEDESKTLTLFFSVCYGGGDGLVEQADPHLGSDFPAPEADVCYRSWVVVHRVI